MSTSGFWSGRVVCCDEDVPEGEGVYWRAEVCAHSDHIHFWRLELVRETPKGVWLKERDRAWRAIKSGPETFWRSHGRAAKTKTEALQQLLYRKRSYVKHAQRRAKEAERQLDAVSQALQERGTMKPPTLNDLMKGIYI